MAKMYYDNDADLALIRGKKVAVIGYGSQGHAHALNLRDSGVEVVVALSGTSKSRARAEAEGLGVVSPAEATGWGDVIVFLAPDTTQPAIYRDAVAPNLTAGKTLFFAHGFNIHFATIQPPARGLYRWRRNARVAGRLSGCQRIGEGFGAFLCESAGMHTSRRHRDDFRRRNRNRSFRRAGRSLRWRERAGKSRLRNPGRSWIPT